MKSTAFVFTLSVLCVGLSSVNSFKACTIASVRRSYQLYETTTPQAVSVESPAIILNPRNFLSTILSSRSSKDEKKALLATLQNLRMAGTKESTGPGNFNYAEFLDEMLVLIDSVEGNIWARRRLPIPLPSLRLKMGSARRLMNTLAESEEKTTEKSESNNMDSGKRRRALGILLNQLAMSEGGVRSLELEALTRLSANTMEEMLKRTPKGLETPKYEVVYKKDTFEVRKYDSFAVCSMMLVDQQQQNGPAGFQTLAGYIFGKNVGSQKMAMTTPVISSGNIDVGGALTTNSNGVQPKKMSFVMPSAFWAENGALNGAPRPLDGSGIALEEKGGGMIGSTDTVAVLWFGGYATKSEISSRATDLLKKISEDGTWKVKVSALSFTKMSNVSSHSMIVHLSLNLNSPCPASHLLNRRRNCRT
jgi:SOUL heme-binding protein